MRLGATRYSETPVTASQNTVRTMRCRAGRDASPRSISCSASACSSIARSSRSPTSVIVSSVRGRPSPLNPSPISFTPITRNRTANIAAPWAAIHALRSSSGRRARSPSTK